MMYEKNDSDKGVDEFMMPGFRFHPTDEELVGFYLRQKLQQRSLPIELIKQVDIYKYDPWDLPKLSTTGEKEWYFYCPRDRKYKNSTRPNRVTGSGFWKATGTDRPIYSSEGGRCIGLKKSLVFYRGRAARGVKTDWMMHEFRLPSGTEPPAKKISDQSLPLNESWAICRIFKKINSTTNRAISALPDAVPYTILDCQFDPRTSQESSFQVTGNFSDNMSTLDPCNSMVFDLSPSMFECKTSESTGHYINPEDELRNNQIATNLNSPWEAIRSLGYPFSLPWDASTSDISSNDYSTNKSFT